MLAASAARWFDRVLLHVTRRDHVNRVRSSWTFTRPIGMHRTLLHALALAFLFLGASHARAQGKTPPNVVLILVDDLGWMDLSCQGSTYDETPNVDRLAREGLRFTNAYAACAVCSPTRAAVMTGRYPARTGVTDWIRARFQRGNVGTPETNPTEYVGTKAQALLCPPNPYWLDREEVTLAELLAANGYRTAHIGKWHLGDDAWYPEHQGFHENYGGCDYGQPPSYFDPYQTKRLPQGIPTLAPRREGEYLTDREGDEAAHFIERNAKHPFFLFYAPYAVHTPLQARPDLKAKYDAKEKTEQTNATYAAMVESMDAAVGRILDALDANGVREQTLVVFTSDNGGLLGPTNNAPLRSGKGYPHEGGLRVPFIVRWPGKVAAGTTSNVPVISVDLLPTIADACNAPRDPSIPIDGVSLLAHVTSSGETKLERDALFWHFPHYRGRDVTPYGVVRQGNWKLVEHYEGPWFELYDLAKDEAETRDLSPMQWDRVQRMHALLREHLAAVDAKLPRPNPDHESKPRPRVLILGDSISMGYTPYVARALQGEAHVVRARLENGRVENCAGTNHGVEALERWLALDGGHWDAIHVNFGLHDLKRVDPLTGRNSNDRAHPHQAEPKRYEKQLATILDRLTATDAAVIWASTTPVPEGVRPFRLPEDVLRYNAIAQALAEEREFALDDLYTFALERLDRIQQPKNVHFRDEGSQELAEQVTASIRKALAARSAGK